MKNFFEYSFLIIFFLFFISNSFISCERHTDFDYPIKKRLNNGNYLVMTTQGIYLYNEEFTSKIDKVIFESRLIESNNYAYSEDIAQFLSEDGGYIICLIRNETYILSKSANFQAHKTLDYISFRVIYQIIPYSGSDNNYYFAIISIIKNTFKIRNYIFHPSDNSIEFEGLHEYTNNFDVDGLSLSCELMTFSGNKVIVCFYGQYTSSYIITFNLTDFQPITERTKKIERDCRC